MYFIISQLMGDVCFYSINLFPYWCLLLNIFDCECTQKYFLSKSSTHALIYLFVFFLLAKCGKNLIRREFVLNFISITLSNDKKFPQEKEKKFAPYISYQVKCLNTDFIRKIEQNFMFINY